jgi:DNA adenine methylase
LQDGDFEDTLAHARAGDFVYLDPPYVVRTRRVFSEYLPHSFSQGDLGRLAKCLDELDAIGAFFVVSYADSTEARALLAKWSYRRIAVRRHIAGFAGARRTNYELIATNLDVEEADHAG